MGDEQDMGEQDGAVQAEGDNPFDMLMGEEIQALEAAAQEALANGDIEDPGGDTPDETMETADEEANESPEEQAAEEEAGTEAPGDLASLGTAAQAFADDCAAMQAEADQLIESAQVTLAMDEAAEGIDVDAAQDAADEIAEPMQACQEAADAASKAVATEDIGAASEAYKAAKEAHDVATEAMGRVREACGGPPADLAAKEEPEAEAPPATKGGTAATKPATAKGKAPGAKAGWGGWADSVLG